MGIEKTNTFKSPLLKPVIERNYTRGISINEQGAVTSPAGKEPIPPPPPPDANVKGAENQPSSPAPGDQGAGKQSSPSPGGQQYNIPADETKGFTFDDIPTSPSDIEDGDHGEGIGITSASAKTFANFVGDAIQLYLPKFSYNYSKIDIENVIVNIQKGILTEKWLEAFTTINIRTEEGLKISDDAIRMWKKAFKDYLEYKNIKLANPETAFWGATAVLLFDQGLRTYQIKKANEEYMRQALQHDSPNLFIKKDVQPGENKSEKSEDHGTEHKAA
jgi:hypothetical protein